MRASCATISTEALRLCAASRSNSTTCRPCSQSRALVGSSAKQTFGAFTSARPTATRRFSLGHALPPAQDNLKLLACGQSGEKVEALKDEAEMLEAKSLPSAFGQGP